jgi:hypothetical protein
MDVTDGASQLEQTTNAIPASIQRELVRDFVISRFKLRGYLPVSVSSRSSRNAAMGMSG